MDRINPAQDIYHLKRENNSRRQNAVTFSCLGKLKAINHSMLCRWKRCLEKLARDSLSEQGISRHPLIIGLAESGIVLSALFHQMLREQNICADWVCSTRRPSDGIHFRESHSHGPDHVLPLPRHNPSELWFVEDEITTGRTILRLALKLCHTMKVFRIRLFAIADTRSTDDMDQFRSALHEHGISHSTRTLLRFQHKDEDFPADGLLKNDDPPKNRMQIPYENSLENWHFPLQRPALRNLPDVILPVLNRGLRGALLVIGEAVDIGLKFVQENPELSLHHITLSPWKIDNRHIFNRLDISGKYYLYNYHTLCSPLYLLNDPIDNDIAAEVENLLYEKGFSVKRILKVRSEK